MTKIFVVSADIGYEETWFIIVGATKTSKSAEELADDHCEKGHYQRYRYDINETELTNE